MDEKSFLAATSPIALTALAIENNEEKNGSDHHSKEARRATWVAEIAEVVFKIRLCRLDLFCYFLPSREKSKEKKSKSLG